MNASGIMVAWLGAAIVGVAATFWWCHAMWKRRSELPPWTRFVLGLLAASAVLGGFGAFFGIVKAFGTIGGESIDPSQKARIIAEGISEAMNCTALGVFIWIPSATALALVSRRRASRD